MAGERVRLEVQEREDLGSRASRRLRKEGLIPGVLYGRGKKPHAFVVPERVLRSALGGPHGLHAILDVVVDEQKTTHASVVKDYQQDPLRGFITHIDLHEVRLDQPISAQVAVVLTGESPGVKLGGVLTQLVREVTVEALPLEMPDGIPLDLSRDGDRRDAPRVPISPSPSRSRCSTISRRCSRPSPRRGSRPSSRPLRPRPQRPRLSRPPRARRPAVEEAAEAEPDGDAGEAPDASDE